ncbi:MAG: MoxR family ATPase [bacterium]|nr:MoxR family ATPase [bacterium]
MSAAFQTVEEVQALLASSGYVAHYGLASAIFLACRLPQPLLLEGEPGVGKTELARALAGGLETTFIRLQCYEGIDSREALYEWNYLEQLLEIRKHESARAPDEGRETDLFTWRFLQPRPLLRALLESNESPAVLLIDEIDRADEAFEAFLLEFLSDFAITIPEIGGVRARVAPIVVITSNRTRELHDGLKRRCLFHWVEYPSLEQELAIVQLRAPEVLPELAAAVALAVRRLRGLDLQKPPGVAESIAWSRAVRALGRDELTREVARQTLGVVIKNRDDWERVTESRDAWLAG